MTERREFVHAICSMAALVVVVVPGLCIPVPASASSAVVPHTVTPSTTNLTTFVGSGTFAEPLQPGSPDALVTSWGDFTESVVDPSLDLQAAVRAFFENGGIGAWIRLTTDEAASSLTSAMDGWSGPEPPQRSDLWTVPSLGGFSGPEYDQVVTSLVALADRNEGLALLEPPRTMVAAVVAADDVTALVNYGDHLRAVLPRDEWSRVAVYATSFPNAGAGFDLPATTAAPVSGVIAGVMATTDVSRGVWRAPAGTTASIQGISSVPFQPTNEQMGVLNVDGLNAITALPGYGLVVWGARTLAGTDVPESQFKYISTRRLADFIEHSLDQSLTWAIFEPNGPALWSSIDLEVTAFMSGLFADGAFAGLTAATAYQVAVDATTTTAADIAAGRLNIAVAFAPVEPAEFIVLQVQIAAATP